MQKQSTIGKYLFESSLKDEEIDNIEEYLNEEMLTEDEKQNVNEEVVNKFKSVSNKKEKDINEAIKEIISNTYEGNVGGKKCKICIVDKFLNCGSWIAYALGCDYYVSMSEPKNKLANDEPESVTTMAIMSNVDNGVKLPEEVKNWAKGIKSGSDQELQVVKNNTDTDLYINEQKEFITIGGFSAPDVYLKEKESENFQGASNIIKKKMAELYKAEKISTKNHIEEIYKRIENWTDEIAQDAVILAMADLELEQISRKSANEVLEDVKTSKDFSEISHSDIIQSGEELIAILDDKNKNIDTKINR